MPTSDIAIGLDIGTTKVCVVVAERDGRGQLNLLGKGHAESEGLQRATVVNVQRTVDSIRLLLLMRNRSRPSRLARSMSAFRAHMFTASQAMRKSASTRPALFPSRMYGVFFRRREQYPLSGYGKRDHPCYSPIVHR